VFAASLATFLLEWKMLKDEIERAAIRARGQILDTYFQECMLLNGDALKQQLARTTKGCEIVTKLEQAMLLMTEPSS
jgi:hypothetical protein